jgi:glyoxylase-like metal-dependent hydrolase (beta-lactamase superfamily II)
VPRARHCSIVERLPRIVGMSLPAFVEDLGHNVFAIDTGFHRPRFDAAYLVISDDGRAAFIDTGTNHALPRHLAALDALGVARDAVGFVIPTHVHLDHAGGAGALMHELPRATLIIHPRGERHMVDPTALVQGALAVYGAEEMARSYGLIVPVPAERTRATHDGMDLMLGSRRLHFIDTPGHAKHHHCIWDQRSRGWFTGDTFGLSYREFDNARGRAWILPTSTPVQFEPEALCASITRLLAFEPACIYLTHYGMVGRSGDVPRLGKLLLQGIDDMVSIGRRCAALPERHQRLKDELLALYARGLEGHGLPATPAILDLLSIDVELNAQGMAVWLDREAKTARV